VPLKKNGKQTGWRGRLRDSYFDVTPHGCGQHQVQTGGNIGQCYYRFLLWRPVTTPQGLRVGGGMFCDIG